MAWGRIEQECYWPHYFLYLSWKGEGLLWWVVTTILPLCWGSWIYSRVRVYLLLRINFEDGHNMLKVTNLQKYSQKNRALAKKPKKNQRKKSLPAVKRKKSPKVSLLLIVTHFLKCLRSSLEKPNFVTERSRLPFPPMAFRTLGKISITSLPLSGLMLKSTSKRNSRMANLQSPPMTRTRTP